MLNFIKKFLRNFFSVLIGVFPVMSASVYYTNLSWELFVNSFIYILTYGWDMLNLYPLYSGFQASAGVYAYELVQLHHSIMYALIFLIIIVWWCTWIIINDFGWNLKKTTNSFMFFLMNAYSFIITVIFLHYVQWLVYRWESKENMNEALGVARGKDLYISFFKRNFLFILVPNFLKDFWFSLNEKITNWNISLIISFLAVDKDSSEEELLNTFNVFGQRRQALDYEVILQLVVFLNNFKKSHGEGFDYNFLWDLRNLSLKQNKLGLTTSGDNLPKAFFLENKAYLDVMVSKNKESIWENKKEINSFFNVYNFTHSGLFETIWTSIPTIVVSCILIPSGNLLYSIDSTIEPLFTYKVIGHQWYWSYEFNNWVNVTYNKFDGIFVTWPPGGREGRDMESREEILKFVNEIWPSNEEYLKIADRDDWTPLELLRALDTFDVRLKQINAKAAAWAAIKEKIEWINREDWTPERLLMSLDSFDEFLNEANYKYISFSYDSNMLDVDTLPQGMSRQLEVDNRLIVPSNVPVRFLVTSSDVLHSFAVPRLGIKMDAVPGRLNKWNSYIQYPGVFMGQCSELCGPAHGFMPIVIHAVPYDVFIDYLNNLNVDSVNKRYLFTQWCQREGN